VSKQHEALSWLAIEETIVAFFQVLKGFGFEHKPLSEMTDLQRNWIGSLEGFHFDTRLRSGEITKIVIGAVNHRIHELRVLDDLRRVSIGDINKLKQIGFYLDADENTEALTLPQSISEQESSWWLSKAKRAAELTTIYAHESEPENRFSTAPFHSLLKAGFVVPF